MIYILLLHFPHFFLMHFLFGWVWFSSVVVELDYLIYLLALPCLSCLFCLSVCLFFFFFFFFIFIILCGYLCDMSTLSYSTCLVR